MALMFPHENNTFHTEGERLFYNFLEKVARPDSDYIVWYTPNINDNEPDFLLYAHGIGLIVFEVKDWALNQIKGANPKHFTLTFGTKTEVKQNPYEQARDYFGEPVGDVLQYFNSVLHILAIEQLKNVPLLLQFLPDLLLTSVSHLLLHYPHNVR